MSSMDFAENANMVVALGKQEGKSIGCAWSVKETASANLFSTGTRKKTESIRA
jgi:hypothetical protein